jgi:hypothetical protein
MQPDRRMDRGMCMSTIPTLPRRSAQPKSYGIHHQRTSEVCIYLIYKNSSSMQARLHAHLLTQIIKSTCPQVLCKQVGSNFFPWYVMRCRIFLGKTLSNSVKALSNLLGSTNGYAMISSGTCFIAPHINRAARQGKKRIFHSQNASLVISNKAMCSASPDD